MKSPRRIADYPASKTGELLRQVEPIEVPAHASSRVWARLQEPPARSTWRWQVPAVAALAAVLLVVAVAVLRPTPTLEVRATQMRLAGQPLGKSLAEGSRISSRVGGELHISGWGQLRLAPNSELELVSAEPMQFILHKGTAALVGRSLTTLTLVAAGRQVDIRWADITVTARGEIHAETQDGDYAISGAGKDVVVRPSEQLQQRQQTETYRLGQTPTAVLVPEKPTPASNKVTTQSKLPKTTEPAKSTKDDATTPRLKRRKRRRRSKPAPAEQPAVTVNDQTQQEGPREWYQQARLSPDPAQALRLFDRVAATDNPWAELATHQAIRNLMRRKIWHEAGLRIDKARLRFAGSHMQSDLHLDAIACALALENLTLARQEAQKFVELYPQHPRVDEMREHLKK